MTTLTDSYKATFLQHYLGTAATLADEEPGAADAEWAPEARTIAQKDCTAFLEQSESILAELSNAPHFYRAEQAGTDFWLTRNGHGAGFWDRGLEEAGETLSKIAHNMRESDAYVGDDGQMYLTETIAPRARAKP